MKVVDNTTLYIESNMSCKSIKMKVQSNKLKVLPVDYVIGQSDVIFGRGRKCFSHHGNKIFRKMINNNLENYAKAITRTEKTLIIQKIIRLVRENNGKFIKFCSSSSQYCLVSGFQVVSLYKH